MYPHVIRLRGPWDVEACNASPDFGATLGPIQMTAPGFWRDFGLPKHWGQATMRRRFQWTAKLEADEVVWLCIDQCFGRGLVRINGVDVGRIDSPWVQCRIDATPHLRPTNIIEIDVDASDPASMAWGTMGQNAGGARRPVGGIAGGVHLSIESHLLILDWLCVDATWAHGVGTLRLEAGISAKHLDSNSDDDRFVPKFALSLDGEIIHEADWTAQPDGVFSADLENLPVQPWRPRRNGSPHRHQLQLEGRVGGINCIDRLFDIGFVDPISVAEPGDAGVILPDRSFQPFAGEDSDLPFDSWSIAKHPTLRFPGHVPPQSLLRLFDRSGTTVAIEIPDLPREFEFDRSQSPSVKGATPRHPFLASSGPACPSNRELYELVGRLRSHPCVIAVRNWVPSSD